MHLSCRGRSLALVEAVQERPQVGLVQRGGKARHEREIRLVGFAELGLGAQGLRNVEYLRWASKLGLEHAILLKDLPQIVAPRIEPDWLGAQLVGAKARDARLDRGFERFGKLALQSAE